MRGDKPLHASSISPAIGVTITGYTNAEVSVLKKINSERQWRGGTPQELGLAGAVGPEGKDAPWTDLSL